MKIQVTLRVKGKVQGVCYRSEAQENAEKLGLTGYAKNNRDSSVTVVLVGEESSVHKMIEWCKKGPKASRVEAVEVNHEKEAVDDSDVYRNFEIY